MIKAPIRWLVLLFSFLIFSCKKESDPVDDKILIIGKWSGISRVSTITSEHPATYERNTLIDSLICGTNGNFSVEFKGDSVITTAYRMHPNWGTFNLYLPSYTIDSKTLSYSSNPFNTSQGMNLSQQRSSNILTLTSETLVLHAIDTLNSSPLYVMEAWFRFRRQ